MRRWCCPAPPSPRRREPITTIEGRVVRCDQAVAPVPRRADIDVIRNLARRLGVGHQFDFVRGREVYEEMRAVSAGGPNDYAGITWERARAGVFWPCPTERHPGTPRLYERPVRPSRRTGPVPRGRDRAAAGRRRRRVSARADDGPAARALPVGQPDQADPGATAEGAGSVRRAAPRHRPSARPGRSRIASN